MEDNIIYLENVNEGLWLDFDEIIRYFEENYKI